MTVREMILRLIEDDPDASVVVFGKDGIGFVPCIDRTGPVEFVDKTDSGEPVPYETPKVFGIFHPDADKGVENYGLPELCFN